MFKEIYSHLLAAYFFVSPETVKKREKPHMF